MTQEKQTKEKLVTVRGKYSKQLGIMLTPECYASVSESADNDGITMSEYVRQLIENDLTA